MTCAITRAPVRTLGLVNKTANKNGTIESVFVLLGVNTNKL